MQALLLVGWAVGSQILLLNDDTCFRSKFQRSRSAECAYIDSVAIQCSEEVVQKGHTYRLYPAIGHHGEVAPETSRLSAEAQRWRESDILEIESISARHAHNVAEKFCESVSKPSMERIRMTDTDVRKLIDNGPSSNRIDVVFMGDGYTTGERGKFFDDIQRLVDEMWTDVTFASYKPVFNVWAVFTPSKASGIGVGGSAKDTPFGLYRDGTELRGIYASRPQTARNICRNLGPGACDFPSIIANDPFYGGLGGEFTIATSSKTSGTIVLRHEMGHNFISVGEEYDGGYVYSGANSDRTLLNIKWKHWLTDPSRVKEEKVALRLEEYPWYDLANGPKTYTFKSDGTMSRWMMRMSASGVETDDSFQVFLDGVQLPWKSSGDIDRHFTEWFNGTHGLSKGTHNLTVAQGKPKPLDGPIRQYCSVSFHEFGAEPDFHMDNSYISAYPTYSINGAKSYRPTNEFCLMRNMTSRNFCPVCVEGMWEQFFKTISLIDNIEQQCVASKVNVKANLIQLGQFREGGARSGEQMDITWLYKGKEIAEFKNSASIDINPSDFLGDWTLRVIFKTPEIRKTGINVSEKRFKVGSCN